MAFDFSIFNNESATKSHLDEIFVDWLVNEYAVDMLLHHEKLWSYYRNDMQEITPIGAGQQEISESARPYRQSQEYGLPGRITGMNYSFYGGILSGSQIRGIRRKEVVIENDIAWRIDTLVDFLFGKKIHIRSKAKDKQRADQIQNILNTVLDANGGSNFFQQLALLGSIYGFVDVILRGSDYLTSMDISGSSNHQGGFVAIKPEKFDEVLAKVKNINLEAIEAPRSLPILDENNYQKINFYIQHYWQQHNQIENSEQLANIVNHRGRRISRQKETHNVEVIGPKHWQRYQDAELVAEGDNPLGFIPVVHIQNMPLPSHYEGQSDVEPLIPLQDELNTRLSDRANRITFQSFKMYLGKGIEGFEDRVVSPGRMWSTENPEATIEEFGGEAGSPSEGAHIQQIREAMEKASGVASVAAGILKGRIGNLTSAVALKLTLMGVLAKTERKRKSYGKGIADICRMVLEVLDKTGIYPNQLREREVEIHWPNPLPENMQEKLQEAQLKKELGISQEQILKELGY